MLPRFSLRTRFVLMMLFAFMVMSLNAHMAIAKEVNLYSAQKEHLIRPVLDAFTKDTGIDVNLITGDAAALVTRLEREGERTRADVLLTVDIGNIYQADQKGLLAPVSSDVLNTHIPAYLRSDTGTWYGLTQRARVMFVRNDSDVTTLDYRDLSAKAWQDGVLIRSSDNVYNQSLLAYMIYHFGKEQATAWAQGVVENMARNPQGGDRDQIRALAAGVGHVAVANTYYYGMMIAGDNTVRDAKVRDTIRMIFPNQSGIGTHVNIRGGGVTTHAKHPEEARQLLEYLSAPKAQTMLMEHNFEYPANPEVPLNDTLKAWDTFKPDMTPLALIGAKQREAIAIMDKVGWK